MALRIAAGLLNFLIFFFITIAFAGFAEVRIVAIVVAVTQILYARATGNSLGAQIIGTRWPWLRATAGFFILVYLGLTLGAGTLIATLTDEKINPRIVETSATDVDVAFRDRAGARHDFASVSFETPSEVASHPLEVSTCCLFFGGYADAERIDPGILIFVD